jgi:hypothetical protein
MKNWYIADEKTKQIVHRLPHPIRKYEGDRYVLVVTDKELEIGDRYDDPTKKSLDEELRDAALSTSTKLNILLKKIRKLEERVEWLEKRAT